MGQMQIKVNGLCHAGDILGAAQFGADYAGMQFGTDKPHRMAMLPRRTGTLPDMAEDDYAPLTGGDAGRALSLIGMFSGEGAQDVITAVYCFGLDAVQFDDDCTPVFIRNLLGTIVPDIRHRLGFIKFFHVASSADFAACTPYEGLADRFIFRFDGDAMRTTSWADKARIADAYHGSVPFLVNCLPDEAGEVASAFGRNTAFCGLDLEPDKTSLTTAQYMQKVREMAEKVKG